MAIVEYILWVIIFILTAGFIGSERFKNNPFLMLLVAAIATVSTVTSIYFLIGWIEQLVEEKVAARSGPDSTLTAGREFRDCADCPVMVVIPSGSFVMGSSESEKGRYRDEGPQHEVAITRFAAGKFEVTFAEWDACVTAGGCGGYRPDDRGWGWGWNRGRRPAINVSWTDAQAYIRWLSDRSGKQYRLLSEAEWEYAVRAGTTTRFPWGHSASHNYANYGSDACCEGLARGPDQWANETAPVGSFAANRFGLHDMHGNVWEIVDDCWHTNYFDAPSYGRPWTSGDCGNRVRRGGGWESTPGYMRSASRGSTGTDSRGGDTGFRVARTL